MFGIKGLQSGRAAVGLAIAVSMFGVAGCSGMEGEVEEQRQGVEERAEVEAEERAREEIGNRMESE